MPREVLNKDDVAKLKGRLLRIKKDLRPWDVGPDLTREAWELASARHFGDQGYEQYAANIISMWRTISRQRQDARTIGSSLQRWSEELKRRIEVCLYEVQDDYLARHGMRAMFESERKKLVKTIRQLIRPIEELQSLDFLKSLTYRQVRIESSFKDLGCEAYSTLPIDRCRELLDGERQAKAILSVSVDEEDSEVNVMRDRSVSAALGFTVRSSRGSSYRFSLTELDTPILQSLDLIKRAVVSQANIRHGNRGLFIAEMLLNKDHFLWGKRTSIRQSLARMGWDERLFAVDQYDPQKVRRRGRPSDKFINNEILILSYAGIDELAIAAYVDALAGGTLHLSDKISDGLVWGKGISSVRGEREYRAVKKIQKRIRDIKCNPLRYQLTVLVERNSECPNCRWAFNKQGRATRTMPCPLHLHLQGSIISAPPISPPVSFFIRKKGEAYFAGELAWKINGT